VSASSVSLAVSPFISLLHNNLITVLPCATGKLFPPYNCFFKKNDFSESEDVDTKLILNVSDKRIKTMIFKKSGCRNLSGFGRFRDCMHYQLGSNWTNFREI